MVYDLDRGEHPKNAGDRAYGHGNEITLELVEGDTADPYDSSVAKGLFVNLDGDGGVYRPTDGAGAANDPLEYDAVLKHSAELGDEVTVHLRGAQRVAETQDVWPVVEGYDNGDELIVLR